VRVKKSRSFYIINLTLKEYLEMVEIFLYEIFIDDQNSGISAISKLNYPEKQSLNWYF